MRLKRTGLNVCRVFVLGYTGTGRAPDQQVNLDMKHGVEAKNYEEVSDMHGKRVIISM